MLSSAPRSVLIEYWKAEVVAADSNSKKRWQILNKLMREGIKSQIPESARNFCYCSLLRHLISD